MLTFLYSLFTPLIKWFYLTNRVICTKIGMSPLLAFSSHLFLYSSLYYAFPICTKIGFFKLIYTLNILFLYRCYSRKEYYMPIPSCSHTITICTKIGQFILYILVLYSPYLQKCSFPPIFVQML